MKLKYSGKKVLVTGGSSKIGLCLAATLMDEGLFPVLTFKNNAGKEKIIGALSKYQDLFETARLDLDDPLCADQLFKGGQDDPDYLVDLAHTDYESLVASGACEKMDAYFNQNITARARLVRSASRSMLKKRFGRLVYISSAAAERPGKGQGFYASSKLACEALYKNCGLELCSKGVTALSIRPGYIDAGRGKAFLQNMGQDIRKNKNNPITIGVNDLCQTILFFLSDTAIGFNGVAVTMDNGLSSGK